MRRMAPVALARHHGPPLYCQVNKNVPLLTMYFDGHSDLHPDLRLNRDAISGLIGQLLATDHHGWGKHLDTLVFLFWLASGTSYRVVARAFDMPKATVCDVVHRVAETILALRRRVINFPSLDGLAEFSAGFQKLGGSAAFRKVVGSIDGCHVRIKPPGENAECYFNRKLFHSIQFQAVCDHRGRFLDIFVGYPGSVHDSRVLKNSPLYTQHLYPPNGFIIIGDGGYPCLSQPITLLTPDREPVRSPVEAGIIDTTPGHEL
ncbi:putative nuclease HARBI1 [Melanotaenia boesemani]|uniref:putative nuclease HARBI1 n=1 Tax=Melanotaenia boesemani TaxID=1250792 RepID=UPI001C053FF6|nr:putative nuclease HARBI1 [Melanotaenia boesemani]